MTKEESSKPKVSTSFLTNYLLEKDFTWEHFDGISSVSEEKRELITMEWRFNDMIEVDNVKTIFKAFNLSYDDFIDAYLKHGIRN